MTIDEIKRQMFIDSEEVCDNTMIDIYSAQEYVERAYNKAIDDFAERIIEELSHTTLLKDGYYLANIIKPLAEKLKEGGNINE